MFKYYKEDELVKSSTYVREPVDNVRKQIENSSSKKIIVGNGRGIGKSVLLTELEGKNISNEQQYVKMAFDPVMHLNDEKLSQHYYEMQIAKNLINYIAKYYSYTYQNNFKNDDIAIKNIINETNKYLRNRYFTNEQLTKYLQNGELTENLINKIKSLLKISQLNLAIDRFDWTNGNNKSDQLILNNYFNKFDSVVITSDDEEIKRKARRDNLINKGYDFINLNYGADDNYIKAIIRNRIAEYNINRCYNHRNFNEDLLTDEVYQYLINKTRGNMNLMINSLAVFLNNWESCNEDFDVEKELIKATNEEIKDNQNLIRTKKPINLYL
jgi:hypothetical protein